MSVKYVDNTAKIKGNIAHASNVFARMAAEEVVRLSKPRTPKKLGNLSRDVVIRSSGSTGVDIVWNKDYAQYQERGMRKDGSRVVRNYTTAGTGKGFAEKSVMEVVKKTEQFVIKATRLM